MSNKVYTEDSIQSLTPLEFTRLRPGVYCGSTEYSTQLLMKLYQMQLMNLKQVMAILLKLILLKIM